MNARTRRKHARYEDEGSRARNAAVSGDFFIPERVTGHENPNGDFAATLAGILRLHGSDHEIALDISGHLAGDYLSATTHFARPYVTWGLTDFSILFLRVDKVVDMTIVVSGRVTWIAAASKP